MTATPRPAGFVDPSALKGVLAKAARSYGQVLAGAGLINGVMASSWAWAPRLVAILLSVIGAVGILAALLVWGKGNISTLRELTATSRTFFGASIAAWVLGAIVAALVDAAWVWWALALVLVAVGAWCAWTAYAKAKQIEAPVQTTGALY